MVFEEAHQYLPSGEARFIQGYARRAVQRVLKEGRKYGFGALVVSQRPAEVDETILSQCGTFIALRLTNGSDQSRVRNTVPDELTGLTGLLPVLRTGEALVLGDAMQIPSRVRIELVEPRPASTDPPVSDRWHDNRVDHPDYAAAVTSWRRQR
jgi:DNA helicase HerA-like ATPase